MTKPLLAISLTLCLTLSAQARAGCPTLESLDNPDGDCASNGDYVDAGISCFLGFENLVKERAGVASGTMKATNKAQVMGKKNSQLQDFTAALTNAKTAKGTLDKLIAEGKATLASLEGYSKNIYFPEDFDAPPSVIGNPWEFAKSTPCYNEPREMLLDMRERTSKYISQLEAARKIVDGLDTKNAANSKSLDNGVATRTPASATKGRGSVSVKKGHSRNPSSTVTGVEEGSQKRRQSPEK